MTQPNELIGIPIVISEVYDRVTPYNFCVPVPTGTWEDIKVQFNIVVEYVNE